MDKILDNSPLGKILKGSIEKIKGSKDWRAIRKIEQLGIKKGDIMYLDTLHYDHIEVFDKRGKIFRMVLNLDGTLNKDKWQTVILDGGRTHKR